MAVVNKTCIGGFLGLQILGEYFFKFKLWNDIEYFVLL